MDSLIIQKFLKFRNCLFNLFTYRKSATMDLIDAVSAEGTLTSVVKTSLSDFFRRQYSSITDVLDSLFRSDLKKAFSLEDAAEQKLKITQLLSENCPSLEKNSFALFVVDSTANPRIYAKKVEDRTFVHAPNHVPGHKPITVGHEYSVLAYLPNNLIDRELHWIIPLSTRRVRSSESGSEVGFAQLKEIATATVFKDSLCVDVADTAYSNRRWIIEVGKLPNVVHIARMRSNRKVYRIAPKQSVRKSGRPLIYGAEIPFSDPPQPDSEEITSITTKKGHIHHVRLDRWNDVIVAGSENERSHENPLDVLRVTVTDKKGKAMYKRPLWLMITGIKRRKVTSFQAFDSYGRRFDIEHYFRFGKQKLGLINSQTCDARHEEGWHWIGLLAYNMLYHAKQIAKAINYPWERKKIIAIAPNQRPSQVKRDYPRIIRGIGTLASIPKPRGKSSGRESGTKIICRPTCPVIRKFKGVRKVKRASRGKKIQYRRMRRVWNKNRPAPMRC